MATEQSWISEQRFNRLVIAGVALGFFAIVVASVTAFVTITRNQRHTYWVNHTYQVERKISRFRVLLEQSEAARRGVLLGNDPAIVVTFLNAVRQLGPALEDIGRATIDNPHQQATVRDARPFVAREIRLLRAAYADVHLDRRVAAALAFRRTRDAEPVRTLRARAERLLAEEDRLLTLRNAAQERSARTFTIILAVSGALLLLTAAGTIWVILRYTRDLNRSRAQLRGLNEHLEDAVRERTIDLQRANEEIQRFAYIVSHDLRSPLVNVMGFTAELEAATRTLAALIDRAEREAPAIVTSDARLAAREDLPEAIGFIRTSTQKMDRLINAILRLSREGRRPITPEPLDMDALVRGILDTLRHRVDELGVEIEVARPLPRIVGDRLAVEQILSNIVENALKYLQPGRPGELRITGAVEKGRAIFAVADNGRGIAPRDHERIFDLFRRSGVQDQPGEGIGLAHTRALAYRLGGTITVESELGQGAVFRVNLPVVFSSEQGALS